MQDRHQALRIAIWNRTQDNCVDNREDRSVGADPEAKCQHSDARDHAVFNDHLGKKIGVSIAIAEAKKAEQAAKKYLPDAQVEGVYNAKDSEGNTPLDQLREEDDENAPEMEKLLAKYHAKSGQ